MLYFTRWKALAIVLTAVVICLCAVPNFFAEPTVKTWPQWAQRRLVLGLDLQGGSHLLLEVDSAAVLKDRLNAVADDVRRMRTELRPPVIYTGGVQIRNNGVEVRIANPDDVQRTLTKLREL